MADLEDPNVVLVHEEWIDQERLSARLRADLTVVHLAALDCASEPPEVRFDTVSDAKGMEFIAACRGTTI